MSHITLLSFRHKQCKLQNHNSTMERQSSVPGDPSFGIVNVETITEGIQECYMAIEESRARLIPFMKIIDGDEADDGANSHSTNHHDLDVTSISMVKEFSECLHHTYASVDNLIMGLADGGLIPSENEKNKGTPSRTYHQHNHEENVYFLMASNCISKASQFIGRYCLALLEADSIEGSGGPIDDHESANVEDANEGIRIQPCMARLTELALRAWTIHATLVQSSSDRNDKPDLNASEDDTEVNLSPQSINEAYAQYQRRCLRTRSKPAISVIADLRREATSQQCFVSDLLEAEMRRQQLEIGLYEEGNDDHGDGHTNGIDDGMAATAPRGQPHAQCLTVILGEASSLIQPLAAWRDALYSQLENDDDGIIALLQQLCQESIVMLDTEAQSLAATVGSWFSPDQRGIATLDKDNDLTKNSDATKSDLLSIEASLEEMAWLCQLISRYCLYSEQTIRTPIQEGTKLQDLLTEQSLHYSTLETRLAKLQFNQALSLATPQLIEIGRPSLQVPSIVEDAHFICVRAIERASGTRSDRAVWTVGHWVCEVWGVDHGNAVTGGDDDAKGVYRALMEGIGCAGGTTSENSTDHNDITTKPAENAFAAALLKAVDEDGCEGEVATSSYNTRGATNSAPTSGGLTSLFGRNGNEQNLQNKIDAELCVLNGISAAETACSALSGLFSDLMEETLQGETTGSSAVSKSPSMLTFARDELSSHSHAYRSLLHHRVRALVTDLGGGDDIFDCDGKLCLQNLRLFIEREIYNLDGASFRALEGEERIEADMIGPIRRSQIFEEIRQDKCDAVVVKQIAEAMSWKSAEIILQVLLQGHTRFTEWGALLLSKQVRMLQNIYCGLVLDITGSDSAKVAKTSISTATILSQFERVNQAVSILQLEKPMDWLAFSYKVGESGETNLTGDEIEKIMSLRVDFSEEAIARVCIQIGAGKS